MSMGLADKFTFGENRGRTVEEVYKRNAGYLCWLRDARLKDNGQDNFFDDDVLTLLDETIKITPQLQKRHAVWGIAEGRRPSMATAKPGATPEPTGTPPWEDLPAHTEAAVACADVWGSF